MEFDEDLLKNTNRLLIDELTPTEAKSLGAAERRSFAARGQRLSNTTLFSDRSRSSVMRPSVATRSHSQISPTILIAHPEHRNFLDHLSGVVWAFLAAYSFSIILFLTKTCGIDLIFGFFLQMIVQTIAFGIYAFYKGYNLLGPSEHRIAMICRALLIGTGTLTSFLAYYYITLPELSAIRQSQVILTIILSIFFLRERVTITRIIAFILTIIAVTILIRPTKLGLSTSTVFNLTDYKTSWIPYSSTWNHIIGIGFVLCTAITHSIASTLNKLYFSTQHLYNTVLCFWSALLALIISIILVYVTHFTLESVQLFPHDWRLFVGVGLALGSIFVFIANQKAIKREHSSIVTLIYSTDILLALLLQNLLTHIKSDAVIILGRIFII
jgi:drug/metabolite transporter (DMT)-like permease